MKNKEVLVKISCKDRFGMEVWERKEKGTPVYGITGYMVDGKFISVGRTNGHEGLESD